MLRVRILIATALTAGCGGVDRNETTPLDVSRCPEGPLGGAMVEVATPDGDGFCIDASEVTNAQYAAFLGTTPTRDALPEACRNGVGLVKPDAAFTTFVPAQNWPFPAGEDDHPVQYMRWCDANAFCLANQKRLCGRMGGGPLRDPYLGGSHGGGPAADPQQNEWFYVCSKGGTRDVPYGDAFDAGRCSRGGGGGPDVPTTSVPELGCPGGFPGIFGMTGNGWEWIDQCYLNPDTAQEDVYPSCSTQGTPEQAGCGLISETDLQSGTSGTTVRCCADRL